MNKKVTRSVEMNKKVTLTQTHSHHNMTLPVLCDDLIVEIFSWLPVKSLMCFKSVNKFFKSLISDPKFVKLHLQRSRLSTNVILKHGIDILRDFDVTFRACNVHSLMANPSSPSIEDLGHRFEPQVDRITFVGSCNGLICLCAVLGDIDVDSSQRFSFYLWNPATGQNSKIYPCLVHYYSNEFRLRPSFGFGYDSLRDTYKVVVVTKLFYCTKTEVKVYNTSDNCWKNIEKFPYFPLGSGVYLTGTLNWLAVKFRPSQQEIVSLDLRNETYTEFSLPVNPIFGASFKIGVLKNYLCFYHTSNDQTNFVLWQMKEFGVQSSWTQLLNINHPDLQIGRLHFNLPLSLGMNENGDVLVFIDYSILGGKIIVYNRRNNTVQSSEICDNLRWLYSTDYAQSLVFPC